MMTFLLIIVGLFLYAAMFYWLATVMDMREEYAIIWPLTLTVLVIGITILLPVDLFRMLTNKKGEQ